MKIGLFGDETYICGRCSITDLDIRVLTCRALNFMYFGKFFLGWLSFKQNLWRLFNIF